MTKQINTKICVSILGTLSFVFSAVAQNKEWSLQECLQHAIENNISIKQSELDIEQADIDRKDAIGALLPSLNLRGDNTWNTGLTQNVVTGVLQTQTTRNSSYSVNVGVTLFDGLRNYRQINRAKLATLASQYSQEKIEDDIALFVANGYLQVLTNKENLKVIESQHEITLQQIDRTKQLVDTGVLPMGDLLEIEATSADELRRIAQAQNDVRISLVSLAQTLLVKDYENFDIEDKNYNIPTNEILLLDAQEVLDRAKKERYEIKIAEENKKIAEENIKIARGAYLPTLGGFFNYNTRESGAGQILSGGLDPNAPTQQIGVVETTGDPVVTPNFTIREGNPLPFFDQLSQNDGTSYGFSLQVPVFNGFATRNNVKRSRIAAERAAYQLEQSKLDLESNVYQAFLDAKGSAKAYDAAVVAVKAQEQAYQYAKDRYDVGLINAFDFSQSKFRLENAQSTAVSAKFNYIFRLKVIELYFGVPVEDIQL